jgi:hypothetical protein
LIDPEEVDPMRIVATEPFPTHLRLHGDRTCPVWCAEDSPSDDGTVLHMSERSSVAATAGGPGEFRQVRVEVEQFERPGGRVEAATVRLDDNTLLTPDEALHVAGLLILAARRAVTR